VQSEESNIFIVIMTIIDASYQCEYKKYFYHYESRLCWSTIGGKHTLIAAT